MIAYKEVKSILNKHKKRDSWFLDDYSINPYQGCGFNCTYCYVHGSKYGENLAEKIVIKKDAAMTLDKQLANRAKKNEFGFIAVGSATDAYMQVEEEIGLTREFLKIILKHRFPVFISTKSELIKRDLDLLKQIDETAILPEDLKQKPGRGVIISFSFSTLDEKLAKLIEPGAPAPQKRLETLKLCIENGFLCGLNAMPLLPFITDTDEELEKIIASARQYGAKFVFIAGLTLFGNDERDSKQLVFKFLRNHYPHLIEKYEEMYGSVYYPSWEYQEQLRRRADALC
ncbi:MAG TPA: radical SAM protein, partial [Chitinophagaceae bacterium]|nr:radical SAM protein [Chitinophagaceae bacterium]